MRRSFVIGLLASAAGVALPKAARATLARGISLRELVARSKHIVSAIPFDARCSWQTIGDRKRIVTDWSLRVERALVESVASELTVRTLGGQIGDVAEWVAGEAALVRGEPAVVFLSAHRDTHRVTALGQGCYPLRPDRRGVVRLTPNPGVSLVGSSSARAALAGRTVDEAQSRIRHAR